MYRLFRRSFVALKIDPGIVPFGAAERVAESGRKVFFYKAFSMNSGARFEGFVLPGWTIN
jgi:hypothetical protein